MAFVGECSDETPIRASVDMIRKGLTLVGAWHYNLKHVPGIMQFISVRRPVMDRLISHVFPLEQVQQAWEVQVAGACAKVVLKPWEEVE